jgi:hypothetical protein
MLLNVLFIYLFNCQNVRFLLCIIILFFCFILFLYFISLFFMKIIDTMTFPFYWVPSSKEVMQNKWNAVKHVSITKNFSFSFSKGTKKNFRIHIIRILKRDNQFMEFGMTMILDKIVIFVIHLFRFCLGNPNLTPNITKRN